MSATILMESDNHTRYGKSLLVLEGLSAAGEDIWSSLESELLRRT